jgi:cell division protein FtsB
MTQNRKRTTYSIRVAAVLKVLLLTTFFAGSGLSYVYLKNREHALGEMQCKLEKDLDEIRNGNRVLQAQIAQLSSIPFLEKRLEKDSLGLVHIARENIVRLDDERDSNRNSVRVVSTQDGRR